MFCVLLLVVSEGSGDCGFGLYWSRGPDWEASLISRPAVKALGPAPERIMTRTEGEVER